VVKSGNDLSNIFGKKKGKKQNKNTPHKCVQLGIQGNLTMNRSHTSQRMCAADNI
jgi:hypothetical protein